MRKINHKKGLSTVRIGFSILNSQGKLHWEGGIFNKDLNFARYWVICKFGGRVSPKKRVKTPVFWGRRMPDVFEILQQKKSRLMQRYKYKAKYG